jgi:hypothetical protein
LFLLDHDFRIPPLSQTFSMSTAQHPQVRAQQAGNQLLSHPFAQQAMSVANGQLAQLDKRLSQYPALNNLEAQTRIPKVYGVISLVGRSADSGYR